MMILQVIEGGFWKVKEKQRLSAKKHLAPTV
jgi:hypothetical protein